MLDIKNKTDWDLLRPLLERFDIAYERVSTEEEKRQKEKNWEILMKGVKFDDFDKFMEDFEEYRKDAVKKDWAEIRQGAHIDNFEEFMNEFEESREDRKLPFRD